MVFAPLTIGSEFTGGQISTNEFRVPGNQIGVTVAYIAGYEHCGKKSDRSGCADDGLDRSALPFFYASPESERDAVFGNGDSERGSLR